MYVPSTRKIISSYDAVFDEMFFSALSYTSRPYSEAMVMRPAVTYTPYDTSSKEQTGNVQMQVRSLFCPCVVRKATAHVETKTLNMRHQAQKGFRGISVGIPQHQKRISCVRT